MSAWRSGRRSRAPHGRFSSLKWLCLSLLSYVLCAFVVDVSWSDVDRALIWPELSARPQYLIAVVAALGTTISPYLLFWQAQQEVEDARHRVGGAPQEWRSPSRHGIGDCRAAASCGLTLSCLTIAEEAQPHEPKKHRRPG